MVALILLTNVDLWSLVTHLGLQHMVVMLGTLFVEEAKKFESFYLKDHVYFSVYFMLLTAIVLS